MRMTMKREGLTLALVLLNRIRARNIASNSNIWPIGPLAFFLDPIAEWFVLFRINKLIREIGQAIPESSIWSRLNSVYSTFPVFKLRSQHNRQSCSLTVKLGSMYAAIFSQHKANRFIHFRNCNKLWYFMEI